jgi:hypothetical protein
MSFAGRTQGVYVIASMISIFGALFSWLFARLDRRVSDLVKVGEAAMAKEEEALSRLTGYEEIRIVERADAGAKRRFGTFRKIFCVMFRSAILASVVAALAALYDALGALPGLFQAIRNFC